MWCDIYLAFNLISTSFNHCSEIEDVNDCKCNLQFEMYDVSNYILRTTLTQAENHAGKYFFAKSKNYLSLLILI